MKPALEFKNPSCWLQGSGSELDTQGVALPTPLEPGSVLGHRQLFCGGVRPATVIVRETSVLVLFRYVLHVTPPREPESPVACVRWGGDETGRLHARGGVLVRRLW